MTPLDRPPGGGDQTLLPVGPALAAALLVLLLLAATTIAVCRLSGDGSRRRAWQTLTAGARAAAQLAVVSLAIGWVVEEGVLPVIAFLLVMFAVAARTAGRRVTANGTWWWAALPIGASVAPVVAGLMAAGLLPPDGIAMIPVTGILLGGALTATVLGGRRALDELGGRHGEVEAHLALGFLPRDARLEVARPAASEALLPGLDQTRTVGLVTLPGAFVGMLLGGSSPVAAGAVQLFVLVALMAVQALCVAWTVELVARGRLHRDGAALSHPW